MARWVVSAVYFRLQRAYTDVARLRLLFAGLHVLLGLPDVYVEQDAAGVARQDGARGHQRELCWT